MHIYGVALSDIYECGFSRSIIIHSDLSIIHFLFMLQFFLEGNFCASQASATN